MSPARRTAAAVKVLVRAALPLALALTVTATAAGCGAGRQAQTYRERPTVDGTNVSVHDVVLRNVALDPPADGEVLKAGSTARGTLTVVNQGAEPDQLVSVTSPAGTVRLVRGSAPASAVPVPAHGTASSAYAFELSGLTGDLRPGQYVDMTFAFDRNGTAKVLVPVSTGESAAPRNTKRPESHADESTG